MRLLCVLMLVLLGCSTPETVEPVAQMTESVATVAVVTEPTVSVPAVTPTAEPLPTVAVPVIDPLAPTVDPGETPVSVVTPTISDDAVMGAGFNVSLCEDVGVCVDMAESTAIGLSACAELDQLAPDTTEALRTYIVNSTTDLNRDEAVEQAQTYGAAIIAFCPQYEPLLPPE